MVDDAEHGDNRGEDERGQTDGEDRAVGAIERHALGDRRVSWGFDRYGGSRKWMV